MTTILYAVQAIYWRRMRLTFRNKYMLATRLAQPILWIAVVGTTFNNMFRVARPIPSDIDYLSFMGAGIVAMVLIFTSLFGGMSLVWDREFGILKEFLAAPIPRLTIPIGNALSVATEGLIQSFVILVIGLFLGTRFSLSPASIIGYAGIAGLISLVLYGVAASVAANLKNTQAFMAVMTFLTMPFFFVSGAIYPLQYMPQGLMHVAAASPVTHGVALIRFFLLGERFSDLAAIWAPLGYSPPSLYAVLSVVYLVVLSVASMALACILFRRATAE